MFKACDKPMLMRRPTKREGMPRGGRARARRAALELPKLRAFQAVFKVGDETI